MNRISAVIFLLLLYAIVSTRCDDSDDLSDEAQATEQSTDSDLNGDVDREPCELPETKYLSVHQVHASVLSQCEQILLLNVVDEEFYDLGHIEGSVDISWDLLDTRLEEVDDEQNIIIYCRKGVRSESAFATLQDAGYEHLWIMQGGTEAWLASDYDTAPI